MSMASQSARPAGGNQVGDAKFDLGGARHGALAQEMADRAPDSVRRVYRDRRGRDHHAQDTSEARVLIEGRENIFLRPEPRRT